MARGTPEYHSCMKQLYETEGLRKSIFFKGMIMFAKYFKRSVFKRLKKFPTLTNLQNWLDSETL